MPEVKFGVYVGQLLRSETSEDYDYLMKYAKEAEKSNCDSGSRADHIWMPYEALIFLTAVTTNTRIKLGLGIRYESTQSGYPSSYDINTRCDFKCQVYITSGSGSMELFLL